MSQLPNDIQEAVDFLNVWIHEGTVNHVRPAGGGDSLFSSTEMLEVHAFVLGMYQGKAEPETYVVHDRITIDRYFLVRTTKGMQAACDAVEDPSSGTVLKRWEAQDFDETPPYEVVAGPVDEADMTTEQWLNNEAHRYGVVDDPPDRPGISEAVELLNKYYDELINNPSIDWESSSEVVEDRKRIEAFLARHGKDQA